MSAAILNPQLFDELKAALDRGLASGELMTSAQIEQQTMLFRESPALSDGRSTSVCIATERSRETHS
jgi:hypothetical protein